jgi:alcohol dehydrogenase
MFQQFPFKTPSILFGHGAISMLGKEARKLEGQRILLITGPSIRKAGILDRALDSLKESSLDVEVNVQGRDTPEPGTYIVEETGHTDGANS